MDFGDASGLMAEAVLEDFSERGAHVFAQPLDESACVRLLAVLASRTMSKRLVAVLAICLMAASAVHAQQGGGGGRGGGGGGRGGGRGGGGRGPTTSSGASAAPAVPTTPLSKLQIVGVIQSIDPDTQRVTIAYEAADAIGWPAGTMPFRVSKAALMKDVTVGEKVRFHLESQQITELTAYVPDPPAQ